MLSEKQKSFYKRTIDIALTSPSKKQVGAILLKKNNIIAEATNLEKKTHPIQARWAQRAGLHEKIYLHAEIAALVKCRDDADTIIVARINSEGKLRNAKPCPVCTMALKEAGIHNVHYTTDDGFVYRYQKIY